MNNSFEIIILTDLGFFLFGFSFIVDVFNTKIIVMFYHLVFYGDDKYRMQKIYNWYNVGFLMPILSFCRIKYDDLGNILTFLTTQCFWQMFINQAIFRGIPIKYLIFEGILFETFWMEQFDWDMFIPLIGLYYITHTNS